MSNLVVVSKQPQHLVATFGLCHLLNTNCRTIVPTNVQHKISVISLPPPPSSLSPSPSLSSSLSVPPSHPPSLSPSLPLSFLFNDSRSHLEFPYPSWPCSDKLRIGVEWNWFKHARLEERSYWTGDAVEQSPSRSPYTNEFLQGQRCIYYIVWDPSKQNRNLVKGRRYLLHYLGSNKGWSQVERAVVNLWYPFTINSNQFFNALQKLHCIEVLYQKCINQDLGDQSDPRGSHILTIGYNI